MVLSLQHNVYVSKRCLTRSVCRPAGRFRLSSDEVVEHGEALAYSHNPVVWPAGNLPTGCRVAAGSIHYDVRSPAGGWVNNHACFAYRHVHTHRVLPGCIRVITFHCSVSSALKQSSSCSGDGGRFWVRHRFVNISGGSQAGVVGQDGWYL